MALLAGLTNTQSDWTEVGMPIARALSCSSLCSCTKASIGKSGDSGIPWQLF